MLIHAMVTAVDELRMAHLLHQIHVALARTSEVFDQLVCTLELVLDGR